MCRSFSRRGDVVEAALAHITLSLLSDQLTLKYNTVKVNVNVNEF